MRKMARNPKHLKYQIKLSWDGKSGGEVDFKGSTLRLDTPVDFGGGGRYPCPDELFFSAVGGCLLTTFLYFQRKLSLCLEGLQVTIGGDVELVGPEGYRITRIKALLHVQTIEEEKAKAKECAALTRDFCNITRTLERAIPTEISAEVICVKKAI